MCGGAAAWRDAGPAVGEAVRNHLPVDAQVPAGLGTVMGVPDQTYLIWRIPSSCPGVFGPVPQPVSMDGARLAADLRIVNLFMQMERWILSSATDLGGRKGIHVLGDTSPMPKLPLAGIAALLLAACSTAPRVPSTALTTTAPKIAAVAVVTETYVSETVDGDELDSLAAWTDDDGSTWLIASAKSSHRLVVFDADSGARLRTVGGKGAAPGEFMRPNGVAVFGDLLFVVERDNRRVQVLRMPEFAPVGSFGNDELRSPYGLWLTETAPDELQVYITDSFMDGPHFDVVPPLAQLGERVRHYRVQLRADGGFDAPAFDVPAFDVKYLDAFGDTSEAAALRMVESIAGDPVHARLLIADEERRHTSNLREYGFDGRYTGRSLPEGTFDGEAEGVALWSCRNDRGYWVAVDQQAPLTSFHLFDRDDLSPRGSFKGTVTAQTDGIALHAAATARFPAGALFAVHDDRAVAAFDLRDIVQALRLDPDCLE